jgi:hypothetical protein
VLGLAYRGRSLLSFENFKRALSNVPGDVEIRFSGYGEPLLNPRCKDMILYAFHKGHAVGLYSTFSNITLTTWNVIRDVPFKRICVHLPDVEGITKVRVTEDYLAVLRDLKKHRNVDFMSMADILPEVRVLLPDYQYSFVSNERAGNCENVELKRNSGRLFCWKLNRRSTEYVMLPDCTVTLCCMDFGLRHRLGNLLETKYDDIYGSEEMQKILNSNKTASDSYALCRTCLVAKN